MRINKGENIYKRKDGRWEGRYIKSRTVEGKAVYGSVYASNYIDVKNKLVKVKFNILFENDSDLITYSGTITDWLIYWLENIGIYHIKRTTYSNYIRFIRTLKILPLGKKQLIKISSNDVQNYVYYLQEKGLSAGSIKNMINFLKRAFKEAIDVNYITKNPCNNLKLPKVSINQVSALTIVEQQRLEAIVIEEDSCSPVLLALYSGMRIGEISGLKWEDIDFNNQFIHVKRTVSRVVSTNESKSRTQLIIDTPKSTYSKRIIPLSDNLKHYLENMKKKSESEFVVGKNKEFMDPRLITYRFKKSLVKAGIKDIRFHSLRHTFATRCLENGVDIASLSKLLGHQSVKMTLDTYSDSMMSNRIVAIKKLDEHFIIK